MGKKILPISSLKGSLCLGGDKSITHRAIILSSLSRTKVKIKNFYPSQDCLSTLKAMRALGVEIKISKKQDLDICGVGLSGLKCPPSLFLGDSGTTYRLLAGLLAGKQCRVILYAGKSLSRRPMKRIVEPLTKMGADIAPYQKAGYSNSDEMYPPLLIREGYLRPISYNLPVASAQVKSAILLASLSAQGRTRIIEKIKSRDHTERMLARFGVPISLRVDSIELEGPCDELKAPGRINIPGDFSSAAFFIVAGLLIKGSALILKNISLNPTRAGLLKVLRRMQADFKIINLRSRKWPNEPVADIIVRYSRLKAIKVSAEEIPLLIDEVPILMVAASLAKGVSRICGVSELRVKETDRIKSMCYNLRQMGVEIEIKDGVSGEEILIKGADILKGARLKSFSDHRSAMAAVIAGLCADKPSIIDNTDCISKSFPDFFSRLKSIEKS